MTKMTEAQRRAILDAHVRQLDRIGTGTVSANPGTVKVLRREGWVSMAFATFDKPTPAGLRAAGVDLDVLHAEALELDAQMTADELAEPVFHYHVILVSKVFPTRYQALHAGRSAQEVCDALVAIGSYKSVEVVPASPVNGYEGLTFKRGDCASWHINNVPTEGTRGAALPATDPHSMAFPGTATPDAHASVPPLRPHPFLPTMGSGAAYGPCQTRRCGLPYADPIHREGAPAPEVHAFGRDILAEARTGISDRVAAALSELAELRLCVVHDMASKPGTLGCIDRAVELLRAEVGGGLTSQ